MQKLTLIILLFVSIPTAIYSQDLLPEEMHVSLVKGTTDKSISLPHELATLDSLQLVVMDSLHKTRPWFTYGMEDSAVRTSASHLSLDLCYQVVNNDNSSARDIAIGISPDAFKFIIERETLDASTQRTLNSQQMIMKDLVGYLQPGPLQGFMYKDVYKKLAGEISTYVIETRKVMDPKAPAHADIAIDYQGIIDPSPISAHERFIINGILNNILVAEQQNYSFDLIPSWRNAHNDLRANKDSLIRLSVTVTDTAGLVTLQLTFSAAYPLVYQMPVDRNPAKMGGELVRTFTISENDLGSKAYSSLIFPICKSMSKFCLLNISPQK
jgi:hypothetical protein